MKIFRRKKNGREVGTYYVRPKGGGKPISLALDGVPCTNADVARKRAALALKGKWPPGAIEAAKRAARAEHVPEDDDLDAGDARINGGDVESDALPPSAPPEPDPSPEPSPGGADATGDPDPIAAAWAAAAEASPQEPTGIPEDETARRERWGREFAAKYAGKLPGGDALGGAGGASPGKLVAMAEWGLVSQSVAAIAKRRKPPVYVVVNPETVATMLEPLGDAWDEQLRRMGLDLSKVSPLTVIIGSAVAMGVTCVMGMTRQQPQQEAPEGQTGANR